MSGRRRRALLDGLPLFATDAELAGAIMGSRACEWAAIAPLLETHGLPKVNQLMGGRYVPGVARFFELDNGITPDVLPAAPDGVEDLGAWKSGRSKRRA